jgi:hypothetical protein
MNVEEPENVTFNSRFTSPRASCDRSSGRGLNYAMIKWFIRSGVSQMFQCWFCRVRVNIKCNWVFVELIDTN